ncbi:hypothetical protein LINGRAHAP2_LOCUS13114 [Linum grandiflorum]
MEDETKSKLTDEHFMVAIPTPNKDLEPAEVEIPCSWSSFFQGTLLLFSPFIFVGLLVEHDYFRSLPLNPTVVSSLVSSKKINGSHLTASWDVVLGTVVNNWVGVERIHASLSARSPSSSPSPSPSCRQDDELVASTRLFPMTLGSGFYQGIQVRVEDAEVAEDWFDSSQVGVSVRIWARVGRAIFSDRYYFVRINCNPDWIGSSEELVRWFSMERKKCQVHLIEQKVGKLCLSQYEKEESTN